MNANDIEFLEKTFKKYYFDHFDLIRVPERTNEREFGFQKFNSGMTRHLSIKNNEELRLLFMQNIPSDVYCSNAYYTFPNLPMNEKDWKEADLIFDIDAKDLKLSCRPNHSVTKCSECNQISSTIQQCSNCNSKKLETKSLTCTNCIDGAKKEVSKLIQILTSDLGIDQKNIQVFFSGNEGFHVYVFNSQFQLLGSRERSDLADYILCKGIIPETLGMKKFKPERSLFADFDDSGWRGRFSKEIFGAKSKRSKLISEFITNGYSTFQTNLEQISMNIGTKIDPNVTMDIHRIFRLPGSLNSKSGMTKIICKDIGKFDPYTEALFLDDENIGVKADCSIDFSLNKKKFGPYNNETIEIPTYAAVYMICKGLASIV